MKRLNYIVSVAMIVVVALAFTQCRKQTDIEMSEVSFSIDNISKDLSKKDADVTIIDESEHDNLPICSDAVPEFARVEIKKPDGTTEVYVLDIITGFEGGTQTEVIKLPYGDHEIVMFEVFADTNDDDLFNPEVIADDGGDKLIWLAPGEGSYYQTMWNLAGVVKPFTVEKFEKHKISIDVLCFEAHQYEHFGFTWLDFNKVKVKNICFVGNIFCYDYNIYRTPRSWGDVEALYPHQISDPGPDFPAMFSVGLFDSENNLISMADNKLYDFDGDGELDYWLGEKEALCVEYLDLDIEYTVKIWVWYADLCEDDMNNPEVWTTEPVYIGKLTANTEGEFLLTQEYGVKVNSTGTANPFFDADQGNPGVWHFIWECSDDCNEDPGECNLQQCCIFYGNDNQDGGDITISSDENNLYFDLQLEDGVSFRDEAENVKIWLGTDVSVLGGDRPVGNQYDFKYTFSPLYDHVLITIPWDDPNIGVVCSDDIDIVLHIDLDSENTGDEETAFIGPCLGVDGSPDPNYKTDDSGDNDSWWWYYEYTPGDCCNQSGGTTP
ncbi:MAG: hypothetical protein ABFS12_15535 [Bacteroidota bacterium]